MTIYQVDSFTDQPFKGNPAGVMILDSDIDGDLMQSIASEMNLSETAFVIRSGDYYKIRYFTPTIEVPICGHATLASAHILFNHGFVDKGAEIHFKAKLDDLRVTYIDSWIRMSFPRFELEQIDSTDSLEQAIGLKVSEFYVDSENGWNLAYVDSKNNLLDLTPDIERIKQAIPGLLVVTTTDQEGKFDFLVRCFAPNAGIDEDPVTGAANCILSTFWKEKLNKDSFISKQMSERTGIIKTRAVGNRVEILGQAKTVLEAKLMI